MVFSSIYILIFLSAIGRIQYVATEQRYWLQIYRVSAYLIIVLGIVFILLRRVILVNRMKTLLCFMLAYETVVSIMAYGGFNQYLFNEFVVDILAWPFIYIVTWDCVMSVGIPAGFKKITVCGVSVILFISVIHLSRMGSIDINMAISGVNYCVAVLLLIYLYFPERLKKPLTIVILVIVVISTKRTSFLALLIGIFVYYISDAIVQEMAVRKRNRILLLMISAIVVSLVGYYMLENSNLDIILRFTEEDGTMSGRTRLWSMILSDFENQGFLRKLLGNGMHAVKYKINPYGLGWYAHNSFIETLYDYGVVGLAALLAFIFSIIRKTIQMNRKKSGLAPIMSSVIPHMLLFSYLSYYFEVGQTILFYSFILGSCIAMEDASYTEGRIELDRIER